MRSLLVALLVTLSPPPALEAQESASETLVTRRRSITTSVSGRVAPYGFLVGRLGFGYGRTTAGTRC